MRSGSELLLFGGFEDEVEVGVEVVSGGVEVADDDTQHVIVLELAGTAVALLSVFDFGGD